MTRLLVNNILLAIVLEMCNGLHLNQHVLQFCWRSLFLGLKRTKN